MADAEADAALPPKLQLLAAGLRSQLEELRAELRKQGAAEAASSSAYCRGFCQALLQHVGNQETSEEVLPFSELHRVAIQSFANARPFLNTNCEDVLVILGRLALSCFEQLLSVAEDESLFRLCQSIQDSHRTLLEFLDNSFEILADISRQGIWKNPVLVKILSHQSVEAEEVNQLIQHEGVSFLQMRIRHLMKTQRLSQAAFLSRLCKESTEIADISPFLQSYITCLCIMPPNEESIVEISKVDGEEVLEMICNLEAEGQGGIAFALCTIYFTQQLHTANVSCSWELTLFWSKLQRSIEPSLDLFLERCRQFGIIARTLPHLLFLIKVLQSEAEDAGIGVGIFLCVRALQLQSNEYNDMKTYICKIIAYLLPEDLEVRRACQLTEYLLQPSEEGYSQLEALHIQPDQQFGEQNAPIPNSLRCELLLALKAYWPFDPEFWDWKTLRRHCLKLLGKEVSESEDDLSTNEVLSLNETELLDSLPSDCEESREENNFDSHYLNRPQKRVRVKKPIGSSKRYQRWLQYKFFCVICKRECIEARILHHSKMHMEDGIFTCPVCAKKFKRKDVFVTHVMEHMKMPPSRKCRTEKRLLLKKRRLTQSNLSRMASASLEGNHPLKIIHGEIPKGDVQDYVTFSKLEECKLQDRDLYPCPGTNCDRIFKQFKYLSVHLKAEHPNNDENAMHYLEMKNRREKCAFCRRHFMSAFHLQEHEHVHSGPRPYMCVSVGCYARFGSVNELLHHKQQHDDLRYKCELDGCNIVFSDLGQLYHHEAQHFRDAAYTCNSPGCKKFYYSKTELTNHLSVHIPNGEVKEVVIKQEDNVSQDGVAGPLNLEALENKESPDQQENLSLPSGSTEREQALVVVKQEPLSDGEEGGQNNGSFKSHALLLASENSTTSMTDAMDCGQSISEAVLPQEKACLPSSLEERDSNTAVYFDGKKFTCGFEGCRSTCKHSKRVQKLLRRIHPYHFIPRRKNKDIRQLESPMEEMNSDSQDIGDCNHFCSSGNCLMEELCPFSPESSFHSEMSIVEDSMSELLLGLKHISLSDSTSSRFLQFTNSEDESTSDHFSEEQRSKLPAQYLAQLAAKPFFCECQGCTCQFVTREALLGHYVRKHNYSKEMVLQLSMFRHRYSPFKCHICQRSFTRKTHLRVHYKNKHKLGNMTVAQKLFAGESFEDMNVCAEDVLNSTEDSMSVFNISSDGELEHKMNLAMDQQCHPMSDDFGSETDLESSEEADSCTPRKGAKLSLLDSRQELEINYGRGNKRTVAKGDMCYILDNYHKPYHCINTNCSAAFFNQRGLIRHYRTVHQYNKEQICLEKDKERTKRELAKCKKLFVCKHKGCNKRFLCSKSLTKHYLDSHTFDRDGKVLPETTRFLCHHPHCGAEFCSFPKLKVHLIEEHEKKKDPKGFEIHCDLNGCNRVFTSYNSYTQHMYFQHHEYDGALRGAKRKGGDLDDEEGLKGLKYQRLSPTDRSVKRRPVRGLRERCSIRNKGKQLYAFRTRVEALKICRNNCNQTQYPCMVRGCPSVVKLESSIVRHYKRTHQMTSAYIEQQYGKLVLCVDCGTTLNDLCMEDSSERDSDSDLDVAGSPADEHKSESHLPNSGCNEEGSQLGQHAEGEDSAEAAVPVDSGTLKQTDPSKVNSSEDCNQVASPQQPEAENVLRNHGQENTSDSAESNLPLPREEDAADGQSTSEEATKNLPFPAPKEKVQKPFDLKSFKPMGFESSFLKFIQESQEREEEEEEENDNDNADLLENERKPVGPDGVDCVVKSKNSKWDVSQGRGLYASVPPAAMSKKNDGAKADGQLRGMQPLSSTEFPSLPSVENLRTILDDTLTGWAQQALKQLHYMRPVVVLERSKVSPSLVDVIPMKEPDDLSEGSS
ncbi:zinc finger protein Rlf [Erythrolamprus reginae]|uniref:zinc finger protein Rlf n=1 Tax=Erythrolamprus reginae TaxID=121349 RepID=UPI00396C3509